MGKLSKTKVLAAGAALMIAAIWGLSFVVVKDVVDLITPLMFIAGRYVIASCFMLAICWKRLRRLDKRALAPAIQVGVPLALAHGTQTIGAHYTTASNAALITGLYIVLVPVVGVLFRNKPSRRQLLIACAAFGGLALFTLDTELQIASGDWWTLACSLFFGVHFNILGRWSGRYDALTLTALQMFAAMLVLTPCALIFEPLPPPELLFSWPVLWPLFFCSLVVTVLGFWVQTAVQRVLEPAPTAVLFSSESLFGTLSGVVFHGDSFLPRQIIGAVILLGSMAASVLSDDSSRDAEPAHTGVS